MRFDKSYCVSISLEELEMLLPDNAKKLIIDECHVDSICDLFIRCSEDCKTIYLFTV